MRRKKPKADLSPEVRAALGSSPDLEPCPKFRRARTVKFIEHVNEGNCEQCLAFLRHAERELEMMRFLAGSKN